MHQDEFLLRNDRGLAATIVSGSSTQCDCACLTEPSLSITAPFSCPLFYYIELTPVCNNRCRGCGNVYAADRSQQPPPFTKWRTIFTKLKNHVFRLNVTGGEPTLHPEFEDIIKAIEGMGIPFALFTNARWPNSESPLTLLKGLTRFSGFLISLHGASPASHNAFTGVSSSFKETVKNIRLAVTAGLSVTTSTVITKYNYREIEEIVQLSTELGADHAVFNRYLGHPNRNIEPTEEQLRQAVREINAMRRKGAKVKFGNCIPQCFCVSSSTSCLAGIAFCTIDPWGNVRPCNHAPLICGNLLEQSVEEVWNSEAMEYWRGLLPSQCKQCLELPKCRGGCRALAMLLGLDKDPLIGKPILEKPDEPLEELILYEDARPIGRFSIRPEEFGYVLIHGSRIMPVTRQVGVILEAFNGQTTLRQIEKRFGEKALAFVGLLYEEGFIELR